MERTAGQRDSELVRQTAELLSLTGPLADLFERFCVLLAQYVDASVVFLALASERGVHIEFAYDHGLSVREAHLPILPDSQTARVMQTGEPLLMRRPEDLPEKQIPLQIPGAAKEDAASAIFVPLRFGSRPIGVLSVQSREPGAYDEHDLQLLETCALYVAVRVQAEFMRTGAENANAAAAIDPVTGVATRRIFEERLNLEWQRARQADATIGVILMDADRFTAFNATYGHVAGDACLAQIAQAARVCVSRSGDLFARYGGESFAAIVRDVTPDAALAIAERMRDAVAALQIPHAQNPGGAVTASFGVSSAPASTDDPRPLLRSADRALYAAKCAGRNRAVLDAPQSADETPQHGGTLPIFAQPAAGRSLEHDALAGCLAISRLTTVAGPPGVGKTRCALAVAQQLAQAYVHGAWFFDLRLARDAADVDAAIASELQREQYGYLHPREAVLHFFRTKHCLIVLDHCTPSAAQICEALGKHARRATILATSRESLAIPGERVFHLHRLTSDDAQALFLARAQTVSPEIILDVHQREDIRALCAHLNGLPGAVELVAAQIGTYSTAQLAAEVCSRDASLEATIAWSYALLDERAQRLFERLSVFGGSFDAEAARTICGVAPLRPGEAAAALDELLRKHLAAAVHVHDEARLILLEPARTYGARRLHERGEEPQVRSRHVRYHLGFARRLSEQLREETGRRAVDAGAREWLELRTALDYAFAADSQPEDACALVLALCEWWFISGHTREARMWIERALSRVHDGDPQRADLLYAAARAALSANDAAALHEYASELLAAENGSMDRRRLARACGAMGDAEQAVGNAKGAQQWYMSALAHYRAADDRRGAAAMLMNLGTVALELELNAGRARTHVLEALYAFREFSLWNDVATALAKLGEISALAGDYESAVTYAAESLSIFERLRSGSDQAWQLASIARYRLERREWERAASALRSAHGLLQEHPHREYAALLLEAGLSLASALERHELAAKIAGHLHAYRAREGVPRRPHMQHHYDRRLRHTRAQLGAGAFETAFSAGQSLPVDAVIAEIVRP